MVVLRETAISSLLIPNRPSQTATAEARRFARTVFLEARWFAGERACLHWVDASSVDHWK